MSDLSKGENRVRTQFNPSQTDLVSELKQKSAELINLCDTMYGGAGVTSEKARCIALAQTAYEEAAMWAVKAATF